MANLFNESYYKKAAWLCEADDEDEDIDSEEVEDTDEEEEGDFEEDEDDSDDEESDEELEDVEEIDCPDCDGTGETEDGEECPTCGGTGLIDAGEDADEFEEEVEDAQEGDDEDEDEEDEEEEEDSDEEESDEEDDGEVYELDLANPVCPACGAKLAVEDDTCEDGECEEEDGEGDSLDIDGFEVADPMIMGPEQDMYYSGEDVGTPVDVEDSDEEEDGDFEEEEEEDDVDEATLRAYNAANYLIEDPSYDAAEAEQISESMSEIGQYADEIAEFLDPTYVDQMYNDKYILGILKELLEQNVAPEEAAQRVQDEIDNY